MIDKSKASLFNFKKDICNRKRDIKISGCLDDGEESDYRMTHAHVNSKLEITLEKKRSIRDLFKLDNFIIA